MLHLKCQHEIISKKFKDFLVTISILAIQISWSGQLLFLWDLLKRKVYRNMYILYIPHNWTIQRYYMPQDSSHWLNNLGKVFQNLEKNKSSVIEYERRPFLTLVMSRSCFKLLPVYVCKFSSHYLNSIIFCKQQFGTL